jgi:hypothetical protein
MFDGYAVPGHETLIVGIAGHGEQLADDARSSGQRHHTAWRIWMPAWARVTVGAPYRLGGMR